LSFGMGVDSSAILARWLLEPESRDFDLSDLTVITAQVGNEFPRTKALVEAHILPLMRENGVRWIQVARGGPSRYDGVLTLSDTHEPYECHISGNPKWKLSDEMLAAGTVPQSAKNNRRCSLKWKGFPLDSLIDELVGDESFRHVMGFNADEMFRVERDQSYSGENRSSEYPLVDWGWGRKKCEDWLEETFGEPWAKSCCTFCPFSNGKDDCMARYREEPEGAAEAMFMERVSVSLNPRMTLYSSKSVEDCVRKDGNEEAVRSFEDRLATETWAVYRVRRMYSKPGKAQRKVEMVYNSSRGYCVKAVKDMAVEHGADVVDDGKVVRFYVRVRPKDVYPALEEMYVAAPAVVGNKGSKKFDGKWADAVAA